MASDPRRLLPEGREGPGVDGPLVVVDAAPLGDEAWLIVMRAASGGLLAAPVVREHDMVRRAVPSDRVARRLADVLVDPNASLGPGFDVERVLPGPSSPAGRERPMLVDQTHESVVVGDDVVVKWSVIAEATPAPMVVAQLAEAGFEEMARPWGFVLWQGDQHAVLVASVAQYLEAASDGWSWAVSDASGFATGESGLESAAAPMSDVGRLVADLHIALSTATGVIADPVGMAKSPDVNGWYEGAVALLDEALAEVDGPEGERLRAREHAIRSTLAQIRHVDGTPTIPVHGDLHVGQVLRWTGGYAVGDFDGNPVLAASERFRPQPAARDVAGMVQSIDHVGRVVSRRVEGSDPARVGQWIVEARSRFIGAYRARLDEKGKDRLLEDRLLLPFQVEQECREYLYAERHLPRWRYVPDQALQALFPDR